MALNLKGISKDDWLTWGAWQFPMLWLVGLKWTLISMAVSAVLGTWGGYEKGHKAFRWLLLPLYICLVIYLVGHSTLYIFLAAPFMIKLAPSYGKQSWLYKFVSSRIAVNGNTSVADLITRLICFGWYWSAIGIAVLF